MKKGIFLFTILLSLVFSTLSAQEQPVKNYIVIGAFSIHENAIQFTDKANKLNFSAQYAINPQRKLYYVYLLETNDKKHAYASLLKIRMDTQFKDAWVFTGTLGEVYVNPPVTVVQPEPIVEKPAPVVVEVPKVELPPPVVEVPVVVEKKPEGKPFYFKLLNAETGATVKGEVHLMESAKASQYQAYNANDLVYLKAPQNTAATYQVSVSAPGYKPATAVVNYKQPEGADVTMGENQESIVTLPLTKSRMGDYIEFNHVFFLNNTSIFQPQSKDEIDGLAQLMKEEAKYKIKIHGHTNGTNDRDIVSMGTSTNYFATDPGNKKERGTAKKLSELRAEELKNYLVSQGIEAKRISVRGEGGKEMIYGPNSTLSSLNDRVEVEVLKGK